MKFSIGKGLCLISIDNILTLSDRNFKCNGTKSQNGKRTKWKNILNLTLHIKRFCDRIEKLKIRIRRVVRVVEGAALEMLCGETHPGFESLTLRQLRTLILIHRVSTSALLFFIIILLLCRLRHLVCLAQAPAKRAADRNPFERKNSVFKLTSD